MGLTYKGSVVRSQEPREVKTKRGAAMVKSYSMLDKDNPNAIYQFDDWSGKTTFKAGDELVIEIHGCPKSFAGSIQMRGAVLTVNGQKPGAGKA